MTLPQTKTLDIISRGLPAQYIQVILDVSTKTLDIISRGLPAQYIQTVTISTQTVTTKALIQKAISQTINVKASTQKVFSKTVTARAELLEISTQTITTKALIQKAFSQTVNVKALIKKAFSQTITAKAKLLGIKIVIAKGDIKNNLSQFIIAKGRILGKRQIEAKALIQKAFSQTITIKASIQKVFSQTITTRAELLETSTQTVATKTLIQKAFSQTITTKASIQKNFSKTITIKASIRKVFSQTITVKAELLEISIQTLIAKANIKETIFQTVNTKTSVKRVLSQTITAKSRIKGSNTIKVKAYIHNPLNPPSSFIEEIAKTVRQLAPKVEIQWDETTWVDESDYFLSARGNEQLWKISGEGIASTLDVEIDNTSERFTPDNTSSPIYEYLKPRTSIRVYITAGGYDYKIFTGYIKNIHPDMKSRVCNLECFDNQVLIYNKRANGIVYENKKSDELMTTLAELAELTSEQYDFETGTLTVNFGYFEDRNVWPIMGEIAVAERGRIFFDREGILTFWGRNKLHNRAARTIIPDITLNNWVTDLDYSVAEHEIKNTVIVQATPRASAGVKVVWSSGNVEYLDPYSDTLVWIPKNSSQAAWLELEDPCTTFITPVANTDFTANSTQDGSGDDLTANIEINEFTNYGNAVFINVINNGAVDAYLTKFQIRGNPAIILKWIRVTATDQTSIDRYGRQEFEIQNNFIDSESAAKEIAEEELNRRKDALNLFRIDIIGIPHLLCGDIVNIEYRKDNYKNYMIDQLDWVFDNGGFTQRLTLVNPYIFP